MLSCYIIHMMMPFFNMGTADDLIMARLMTHTREKFLQEERV